MTKIIETPTLQTERLVLRPVTLKDAPMLQKHFNNWNIIKNLLDTVPWPYPDDGAEDYLQNRVLPQIERGETYVWTLNFKGKPHAPIGLIEYRHITDRDDNRGFWLAEPYWRKRLMTEAVTAINDFIFFDLGVDQITVCNVQDNKGSHRVKEKTGAAYVKTIEMNHHQGKQKTDVWTITAKNWKKFRQNNA